MNAISRISTMNVLQIGVRRW